MTRLFSLLCTLMCVVFCSGCGTTISFEDIEISQISENDILREFNTKKADVKRIKFIVENKNLSAEKKITTLARDCNIYDFAVLFRYINYKEIGLKDDVLKLNSAREIFEVKMKQREEASFECVEAAMIAASLLKEKGIKAYILLIHGLNLSPGHALCIFRTPQGWATVGINPTDFIEPIELLDYFKEKLNYRIRNYLMRSSTNPNIRLFSICDPEELHPSFINGEEQGILWANIGNFFGSSWY